MASIFMWKAPASLPSSSPSVVYYHGVDWFMEEREDATTVAYHYLYRSSLEEGITHYQAVRMPVLCTGLLEVVRLPYQLLRKGRRGEFCQVGDWMRVILYSEGETYDWKQAQEWMNSSVEEEAQADKAEADKRQAQAQQAQAERLQAKQPMGERQAERYERGGEKGGRGRGGFQGKRGGRERQWQAQAKPPMGERQDKPWQERQERQWQAQPGRGGRGRGRGRGGR